MRVELNDANTERLMVISHRVNKSVNQIVNEVLDKIEIVVPKQIEEAKPQVHIQDFKVSKSVKVRHNRT